MHCYQLISTGKSIKYRSTRIVLIASLFNRLNSFSDKARSHRIYKKKEQNLFYVNCCAFFEIKANDSRFG